MILNLRYASLVWLTARPWIYVGEYPLQCPLNGGLGLARYDVRFENITLICSFQELVSNVAAISINRARACLLVLIFTLRTPVTWATDWEASGSRPPC